MNKSKKGKQDSKKKETTKPTQQTKSNGKQNISENSTMHSSLQTNDHHDISSQDEDRAVEEFAKKLEYISKQPPMRFTNQGRRRRKLKPNVSKDWIQTLQKQLKSQTLDKENTHIDS